VAIEIADAADDVVEVRNCRQRDGADVVAGRVEQPDAIRAGGLVAPDQVDETVAVHVAANPRLLRNRECLSRGGDGADALRGAEVRGDAVRDVRVSVAARAAGDADPAGVADRGPRA